MSGEVTYQATTTPTYWWVPGWMGGAVWASIGWWPEPTQEQDRG